MGAATAAATPLSKALLIESLVFAYKQRPLCERQTIKRKQHNNKMIVRHSSEALRVAFFMEKRGNKMFISIKKLKEFVKPQKQELPVFNVAVF